jgi:hypothetical protein
MMLREHQNYRDVMEAAVRLLDRAEHARDAAKVYTTVYWQDVILVVLALDAALTTLEGSNGNDAAQAEHRPDVVESDATDRTGTDR